MLMRAISVHIELNAKYLRFSIQFSLIIKKRFKTATVKLVFLGVISFDEHKQVC